MNKRDERINALKTNWQHDPCWDIEDTEGFEAHREHLLDWRLRYECRLRAKHDSIATQRWLTQAGYR